MNQAEQDFFNVFHKETRKAVLFPHIKRQKAEKLNTAYFRMLQELKIQVML